MVVNRNGAMVVAVAALLLLSGLPLAAWYAGRASVHCPDPQAEQERAEGELRRMIQVADSAQAETARWQARYDSLRSTRQRPVKQQIHETRHYLRGLGLDALVDSLGARPDE